MGPPGLVLVANIATVTSTTPMKNCSELVMPAAYNLASTDDLAEQSNCEDSKRSCSEGDFFCFPNTHLEPADRCGGLVGPLQTKCNQPPDFIVKGEQHYWVHTATDRFTGQVIDKQIEIVND